MSEENNSNLLEDIEPVNLLEEGFNDTIRLESMENERSERSNSEDDESSNEAVEALVNQDETAAFSESEKDTAATSEEPAGNTLDSSATYDLGDGITISGKEAINRLKAENRIRQEFGKLGQQKHELKQKEAKLNQDLQVVTKHLTNLSQSENKIEAIKSLVSATGVDADEWLQSLASQIAPELEKMNSMSDYDRELAAREAKIRKLESEMQRVKEQEGTQQYKQQIQQQVQSALQQHGLSQEDFNDAYYKIVNAVQQGELTELQNADEKTALNAVIDFAINDKALTRIDSVLDKINPELKNNSEVVKQLYSVIRNPYRQYDVTDADIEEIVRASFGDTATATGPATKAPKNKVKVISTEAPATEEEDLLSGIEPVSAEDLTYI